jgi:hypothetical protein
MPTDNSTIELTICVKGRAEPIRIGVPSSIKPAELVGDLQEQSQIPQLRGRHVAVTHGTTNLQLDVPIDQQGVKNGDTLTVVWDGELATVAS